MQLAILQILVDLGMKRILYLLRRAAEFNPGAAAGHALNLQALRLKPRRDSVHVTLAHTETAGILFRCQPLVIIGRSWILLAGQQLLQGGLLACRRFQNHRDGRDRKGSGHRPLVQLPLRLRRHVTSQHNGSAGVDRHAEAVRLRAQGDRRESGSDQEKRNPQTSSRRVKHGVAFFGCRMAA